jgi:hypothetical protein
MASYRIYISLCIVWGTFLIVVEMKYIYIGEENPQESIR